MAFLQGVLRGLEFLSFIPRHGATIAIEIC
jgi:hypothetical protein